MREPNQKKYGVKVQTLRAFRTDEDFKDAYKRGTLPWSEIQRYLEWRKGELKDCRVAIRISLTDVMKLKELARLQEKKFHSYLGEILRREIHFQEDRLASVETQETGAE
jgi:predicted DNA binding CopG/RHH family protein